MRTVRELGEFGLIDRLRRLLPTSPSVIEGIGEDCAVVRLGDRVLLVSCDQSIEGIHFRREYARPDEIGWKAAAVALNDIAAVGGAPLFALVGLGCPADTEVHYIEEIYRGMTSALARYGTVIVGGDTAKAPERIFLDVVVVGQALGNHFLRRKGAQVGDLLAVTGWPGMSGAGLHALQHGMQAPELIRAHLQPPMWLPEGQWLAARSAIHALIDVSDGLTQDAGHLAQAAHLGVNIVPEKLPVAEALARYCEEQGLVARELVLTGGEDYELLFAMSPRHYEQTLEEFHHEFRTLVTIIGEFTDAWTGVRVAGQEIDLTGFDHFR